MSDIRPEPAPLPTMPRDTLPARVQTPTGWRNKYWVGSASAMSGASQIEWGDNIYPTKAEAVADGLRIARQAASEAADHISVRFLGAFPESRTPPSASRQRQEIE